MSVIGLVSGKGSPGVTTAALSLALTWPIVPTNLGACVLMIDADPAGSGTGSGYLRGAVPDGRGLTELAAVRELELTEALWRNVIGLDEAGTRLLLVGMGDPAQAPALSALWPVLARLIADLAHSEPIVDVLLDLGRVGSTAAPTPLLEAADVVLVVTRSTLASAAGARSAVRGLLHDAAPGQDRDKVRCLVVGAGQPYSRGEIARALDVPVVGELAWDPVAASVLSDGAAPGWRFARSPLLRSAHVVATHLTAFARPFERPAEARTSGQVPSDA